MRAICDRFKDSKRTGKKSLRRAVSTLEYVYEGDVVAIEGRFVGGVVTGDARLDALALASRARKEKSEVAHYYISPEKTVGEGESEEEILKKMLRAGHAWARVYAPGRSYVLVVHRDRHVHIVVESYNANGRALHISASAKRAMQLLEFTTDFQPNQQTPNPKLRRTYDRKAVNAHAKVLGRRLVDGETTWEKLLLSKEISSGRTKAGQLISFDCRDAEGQLLRISVVNVEKHAERERKRRASAESALATKAKAQLLASSARRMMSKGLSDAIAVVDEIATEVPVATGPRGRTR